MTDPFRKEQYLMLALDPIHIGTGGYRLGRVDNTIIREPGTNLPKVPGTSLSGALRSFMAMQNKNKYPSCAGQGQEDEKTKEIRHCGEATCPVCMSFGFSYSRNSFQGLVQLSDAYLLFFPVYSRLGPVWITSPAALETAGFNGFQTGDNEVKTVSSLKEKAKGKLNLGWLMLPVAEEEFEIPKKLDDKDKIPESILNRAVLVSDSLFSHIVNDNLEVRTSVAIDPDTGAAADKALFTYEAIPRTAVLQFYATITEPQLFKVPPENKKPDFNIDKLSANLSKASEYLQWLGIGGMNTRGMGRMRTLARLEAGKNE
ncbi:MAG: type III-B CRISPR module RAMP protein Cmr4 [Firmicutes bacterium]|nr:type III-B CRISPR module RAMP protein Cmr4 [Bacillota bacterium]